MIYQQMSLLYIQMGRGNFYEPEPGVSFQWIYDNRIFPIRSEIRGENHYWYMRKMIALRPYTVYLAPHGKLEPDILDNAARHVLYLASCPDKLKE